VGGKLGCPGDFAEASCISGAGDYSPTLARTIRLFTISVQLSILQLKNKNFSA
jgi:hypothetical protein